VSNPDRVPGFWESKAYKDKQSMIRLAAPPMSFETRQKISAATKANHSTLEYREAQSARMKQAVLKHPESYSDNNVVGRSKHFTVDGIRYNSTWEYEVAQYLNENNIKWQRSKITPIPYVYLNKPHLYFPDFVLLEYDVYVEVKGYETDKDRAKWAHSDKPVIVIKQDTIDKIKKKEYNIFEKLNILG
jgi:hypothetical protein